MTDSARFSFPRLRMTVAREGKYIIIKRNNEKIINNKNTKVMYK